MTAQRFTINEARHTEAGRQRGIILDAIASRCGQPMDVHPLLLEGIEEAARTLAAERAEAGACVYQSTLEAGTSRLIESCRVHTYFDNGVEGNGWVKGQGHCDPATRLALSP